MLKYSKEARLGTGAAMRELLSWLGGHRSLLTDDIPLALHVFEEQSKAQFENFMFQIQYHFIGYILTKIRCWIGNDVCNQYFPNFITGLHIAMGPGTGAAAMHCRIRERSAVGLTFSVKPRFDLQTMRNVVKLYRVVWIAHASKTVTTIVVFSVYIFKPA